jgi:glyoxylase-like metal-dependent hydrolase (beta-lactamase superfamily II)
MSLSCNAYLIKHRDGWLMWDTGTPDGLVDIPGGRVMAHGIRAIVTRTIESQLDEIGVAPDEIDFIIISHAHYDHAGNCRLFRKAKWIVHQAERDAMFGDSPEKYGYLPHLYETIRSNSTLTFEDEHDVFGDGAVRVISTPGHTLGHCSLLVHLPETGKVLLSGDIAHNRSNFCCRRIPAFNADKEATVRSMEKVEALLSAEGATMWINHDIVESETLPHAPAFIT